MKRILIVAITAFLAYNSFYFKTLSEIKKQKIASFNFKSFADSLYFKGILPSKNAIDLALLLNEIKTNPDSAFHKYGNRLGIGNSAYFMVKTEGQVVEISDGKIKLLNKQNQKVSIETQFIFGNAIRDASKLVKLTDFKTTDNFNTISEALNNLIREKIIPKISKNIKIGDEIMVTGALKISKKVNLPVEILPVIISIGQNSKK
jgi:predicted lipoprotein